MQPRIARQRSNIQNEDKQNCLNITTIPKKKFTSWRNVFMRSTQKWPFTRCQSSSWRTRRDNWLNKWRVCHKAWRAAATATKHRKDLKTQMEWLRLLQHNWRTFVDEWRRKERNVSLWFSSTNLQRWRKRLHWKQKQMWLRKQQRRNGRIVSRWSKEYSCSWRRRQDNWLIPIFTVCVTQ